MFRDVKHKRRLNLQEVVSLAHELTWTQEKFWASHQPTRFQLANQNAWIMRKPTQKKWFVWLANKLPLWFLGSKRFYWLAKGDSPFKAISAFWKNESDNHTGMSQKNAVNKLPTRKTGQGAWIISWVIFGVLFGFLFGFLFGVLFGVLSGVLGLGLRFNLYIRKYILIIWYNIFLYPENYP